MEVFSKIIISKIMILFAILLISGCTKASVTTKERVLFDFEDDSELDRFAWKCRGQFALSSEYKNTGSQSLKFEFHPYTKVGFSSGDVPQDWSIYRSFGFWVYNPSPETVPIYFQLNRCGTSGRFTHLLSKHWKIKPGENTISIPLDNRRDIASGSSNLKKVDGFFLYMQDIPAITVLYFDSFKLIKGAT